MRFSAYKTSKKMVFISFLIIGLMSFLAKTSLNATEIFKMQDPVTSQPDAPLIILFFEDQTQNDQAELLVKKLIKEQGLLDVLGIQPNLQIPKQPDITEREQMAAPAASTPYVERAVIPQQQESKFLTENVEFLQFIHRTDKPQGPQGMDMIGVIKTAKEQNRPVIMIVGGDKGDGFAQLTNNKEIDKNAIHSVILFDPKVGKINYNAIEQRVYNFYTHEVPGSFTRKFTPGNNGFIENKSKILNILCYREYRKPEDGKQIFFDDSGTHFRFYSQTTHPIEEKKSWFGMSKDLFKSAIGQERKGYDLNIPAILGMNFSKIIFKANQLFNINWDLVCVTNKSSHRESTYYNIEMPLLFINRPIVIRGEPLKEPTNYYLENKTENWSYKISFEKIQAVKDAISRENKYNIIIKAQFMTGEGIVTSPTVSEIINKNFEAGFINKILRWKLENLGTECLGTFFIPHQDGLDLMVFVRSGDKQSIETSSSFNMNIPDTKEMDEPPYYLAKLGQGNDFLYYAVLKFKIAPKHRGLNYNVLLAQTPIASGSIPPIPPNNFTFAVYGDVQKQNPSFPHEKDESGSAAKYLYNVFKENGDLDAIALHLIVGDLVLDGSDLVDFGDILKYLKPIVDDHLMATAIGTHDFASKVKTYSIPGFHGKPKILYFDPIMPTMGHLFYFRDKQDQDLEKLAPNQHVEKTHGYFDVGRTRFIHLPLATEEENSPTAYEESDDQQKWSAYSTTTIFNNWMYTIGGGFWFNFAIADQFIANLRTAHKAKTEGKLDFIIVYGHAPLVTAPNYKMHHKGLFNTLGLNTFSPKGKRKRELAERILPKIASLGVDAYFCGHNHHYDRCSLEVNFKDGRTVEIPMVTIGLGNELRTSTKTSEENRLKSDTEINDIKNWSITSDKMLSKSNKELLNKEHVLVNNLFLPAYLKCEVKDKTITCKLLGQNKKELDSFQIIDSLVQPKITQEINLFKEDITQKVTRKFEELGITNWTTEQIIELTKPINEAIDDIFHQDTGLNHFSTQLRGIGPGQSGNDTMRQGKNFAADLQNKITGFVTNLIQQQKLSEPEIIQLLQNMKIGIMTAYGQLVNKLQQITGYIYSSHSFEEGQIKPNPVIEEKTSELRKTFSETNPQFKDVINIWIDGFNTHLIFAPTQEEINATIQENFDDNKVRIETHIRQMSASLEEEL